MLRYWKLLFLFIAATTVWGMIFFFFHNEMEDRVVNRSRSSAQDVARHLLDRLQTRFNAIDVLGKFTAHVPEYTQEVHEKSARTLMEQYIGFYSINWNDKNGIIRWVYPVEPNQAAINKDLKTRPEIYPLLEKSRATGEVLISTRIRAYQGFWGTTVYSPMYRNGQFQGWISALINYNLLLSNYFAENNMYGFDVELKWSEDAEPFYVQGDFSKDDGFLVVDNNYPMFNRQLHIRVKGNLSQDLREARTYFFALFAAGILVLLLLFLALAQLLYSEGRLLETNRLLTSKNTLVSALSHDLSTNVMVMSNNLRKVKQNPNDQTALSRLEKTIQSLLDLLLTVRNLHVSSLAKEKHHLEKIDLALSLEESLDLVRDSAEKKKIQFSIQKVAGQVLANRITLINCVLLNVLQNAVKFSEVGGLIEIKTVVSGHQLGLAIRDHGVGIDPQRLQKLFLTLLSPTTEGTASEPGSGLGLFQVKYFMEGYGGRVDLTSSPTQESGTTVTMWFRQSEDLLLD